MPTCFVPVSCANPESLALVMAACLACITANSLLTSNSLFGTTCEI